MKIGAIIKRELKKEFTGFKFSVKSDRNSVKITWKNGPSEKKVEEITNKYKKGHFNCMTDSYEFNNYREDIPQVHYVNLTRIISEDIYQVKFNEYKKKYMSWENLTDIDDTSVPMKGYSPRGFIRHELFDTCLER